MKGVGVVTNRVFQERSTDHRGSVSFTRQIHASDSRLQNQESELEISRCTHRCGNRPMVFTGSLKKKGDHLPVWKRRHFVLSLLELSHYEHEDGLLKGIIQLTQTTKIRQYPFPMMENTFQIRDRRAKIEVYLWADSYEMMLLWINALNGAVQRSKSLNSIVLTSSPSKSLPSSPVATKISSSVNQEHSQSPYNSSSSSLFGSCQCDAIHLLIHCPHPLVQAYCHCKDCQTSSSSPFTSLLLFPSDAIEIVKGNVFLGKYALTHQRFRYFCRQCSSYLMFDSSSASSSPQLPSSRLSTRPSLPLTSSSSSSSSPSPRKALTSSLSSFIPSTKYTAVLLGTLSSNFPFDPTFHMMYASHIMEMHDGLPKYRGCPVVWGGTDDRLEEGQSRPSLMGESDGSEGADGHSNGNDSDRKYKENIT
jgi:hypothetical protein